MRTLKTTDEDEEVADSAPCLVIVAPDAVSTFRLPDVGTLTVGRGDDTDVRLSDPLVSRRHLRLHVAGERIEVEDLGSANGTRIRDLLLEPGSVAELLPGDSMTIGASVLVYHRDGSLPVRRRAWPHSYFSARVEHECAGAAETHASFALVLLHFDEAPAPGRVVEVLSPALRPIDVLGRRAADEYELLLPATNPMLVRGIVDGLAARLRAAGLPARAGHSCYGRDGESFETLASIASDRARGLAPGAEATRFVVRSPAMRKLYELAERVAASDINILVVGETGVGKEILVQTIHRGSARARAPLLALNCAAVSESLLESELFGHERGAFTGAVGTKPGLLETAPGGTVFLDEIGEMSLGLQAKLLRVIETREVRRVGGLKGRAIDVRLIAATHRDLGAEAASGRFRRDLYFRLNGITLAIPPLRERPEEILALAEHFLVQFARRNPPTLSREATAWLLRHTWPGNIRELRNVIERSTTLCTSGEIAVEHFAADGRPERLDDADLTPAATVADAADERERVVRALELCAGNQSRAAKLLGIARSTLIDKIKLYGLRRPRA
jgi:DNA-binding NtrC family response regulator